MNIRKMGTTGLIAIAIMLGTAVSASATTGPTAKLTPNANLHNGQVIRVSSTGLAPKTPVLVEMCTTSGICDVLVSNTTTTNSHGAFTTSLKVITGLGAGAGCGMSTSTLHSCVVRVTWQSGGYGSTARTIQVTINFALNTVNGVQ